jgi:hypothetical protein
LPRWRTISRVLSARSSFSYSISSCASSSSCSAERVAAPRELELRLRHAVRRVALLELGELGAPEIELLLPAQPRGVARASRRARAASARRRAVRAPRRARPRGGVEPPDCGPGTKASSRSASRRTRRRARARPGRRDGRSAGDDVRWANARGSLLEDEARRRRYPYRRAANGSRVATRL